MKMLKPGQGSCASGNAKMPPGHNTMRPDTRQPVSQFRRCHDERCLAKVPRAARNPRSKYFAERPGAQVLTYSEPKIIGWRGQVGPRRAAPKAGKENLGMRNYSGAGPPP